MAGAVTLTKFNISKKARAPHKKMGADGRFYFKGRSIGAHLKHVSKTKRLEPRIKPGRGHRFQVGQAPIGSGPLGTKFTRQYKLQDLIVAIKEVEDEIAIDPDNMGDDELLVHFVRRAFKSDSVLKDIMKKLLPDLKHVEADIDVTEQFQLIIDATGSDDEDDIVDVKALPAPNVSNVPKRRVKVRSKRKRRMNNAINKKRTSYI